MNDAPLSIPESRLRALNEAGENDDGQYVLYWMVGSRRTRYNFALQRAIAVATALGKPLIVFEALRFDYPWASRRLHQFVAEGMLDNAEAFSDVPVTYYPYLEPEAKAAQGLLESLADDACLVVSDDVPMLFLPRMQEVVARRLAVRMEVVDSVAIYPFRDTERVFTTAASFRRHLQKVVAEHVVHLPLADPLEALTLPTIDLGDLSATDNWAPAPVAYGVDAMLEGLSLDDTVGKAPFRGGQNAARAALDRFLFFKLGGYHEDRNKPEDACQSYLSPYLHFGHISPHELFVKVVEREDWSPDTLPPKATGSRRGWWGMSEAAEAFLDQIITWREIGHNAAAHLEGYTRYETLPDWAKKTMAEHRGDTRPRLYTLEELDNANTYDELWNAAQRQLKRDGVIHNYLRMLWGKKIYEWSPSPEEALERMVELNNRYALDGRDPNSYSGIFWVLGRYDRAWGPEREIFGKIRYMTSESAARKFNVKGYLKAYAA